MLNIDLSFVGRKQTYLGTALFKKYSTPYMYKQKFKSHAIYKACKTVEKLSSSRKCYSKLKFTYI